MAERDAVGGRNAPSSTSRGGNGQSASAASKVKVDVSDIQKLNTLLATTVKTASQLSKIITEIGKSGAFKSVTSDLTAMQNMMNNRGPRGGSRGSGGSSPVTGNAPTNSHQGSVSAPVRSYNTGQMPSYGEGGGGFTYDPVPAGGSRLSRAVSYLTTQIPSNTKGPGGTNTSKYAGITPLGAGAFEAGSMLAKGLNSMAGSHLSDAADRSYITNRYQLNTGGGFSGAAQQSANQRINAMYGGRGTSYADITGATGSLLASGGLGGSFGASRVQSSSFAASLNPGAGVTGGAQAVQRIFTPQNYYKARLAGINMTPGTNQNLKSFYDQFIARYEQTLGRKANPLEIQKVTQPGTGEYLSAQAVGISDPTDMQNLQTYWLAKNSGSLGDLGKNLTSTLQKQGQAKAGALTSADKGLMGAYGATSALKAAGYNSLSAVADNPLGAAVTGLSGMLNGLAGPLGVVTKLFEVMAGAKIAGALLGGGGGGLLSKLPGVGGLFGGGADAEAGGSLASKGLLGGGIASLGAMGVALAGGAGISSLVGGAAHRIGNIGKNKKTGKQNSIAKAFSDAFGSKSGMAKGMNTAIHDITHPFENPFGDSNRTTPPAGGDSGQTYTELEQLFSKGPSHNMHPSANQTTGGGHAKNSYHYKGQAVDFTGPTPSRDSKTLLAINQWWAKNYGTKLAELIYAGPGGTNIKNGKVVSGNGFYGAATMAEHHNHVHVAATPAELAGAGGGVTGSSGGSGASSASSSGGFAGAGAYSSSGLGSSSSMSTLMAALSGSGGGGMTGGGGGGGGGSSSSGTASTAAPTSLSSIVAMGKQMAGKYGWGTGSNWNNLYALWNQESGWNPKAKNPSSGAYGIPQSLPGSKMASAGADWQSNPATQMSWGLSYIKGRYGSPNAAEAHEKKMGWYEKGKWELLQDEVAQLHKGETVVPASAAKAMRDMVDRASSSSTSGSKRITIPTQFHFHLTSGQQTISNSDMKTAAKRFQQYVEEDGNIELVASS